MNSSENLRASTNTLEYFGKLCRVSEFIAARIRALLKIRALLSNSF